MLWLEVGRCEIAHIIRCEFASALAGLVGGCKLVGELVGESVSR